MTKATSRAVHHAFSRYLEIAHRGGEILITKRGQPWARLVSVPAATPRQVTWPDVSARAHRLNKGRKVEAVKTLLQMREEERW